MDENMTYLRLNRQDVDGIYIVTDQDCIYYTVSAPDHKSIVSPWILLLNSSTPFGLYRPLHGQQHPYLYE